MLFFIHIYTAYRNNGSGWSTKSLPWFFFVAWLASLDSEPTYYSPSFLMWSLLISSVTQAQLIEILSFMPKGETGLYYNLRR